MIILKNVQKLAGLTLKVARQLWSRLAQCFPKGSGTCAVLALFAQFAHFRWTLFLHCMHGYGVVYVFTALELDQYVVEKKASCPSKSTQRVAESQHNLH